MIQKNMLLAVILLFVIACGGGSSENSSSESPLNGTWIQKSGCQTDANEKSYSYKLQINGIDLVETKKDYDNNNCEEDGILSHTIYNWELIVGENTITKDGENALNVRWIYTNEEEVVGFANDLIDFGDFIFEPIGLVLYRMYKVNEKNELLFSHINTENNGTSDEYRMNDFTNSIPLVKQN